ncbi:hypothetical protein AB4Y90_14335, partial [Chryseobacterium sp. 2TAF14]|uniref:hypothetical protein n=1 Tax=Chryseobacterium sp. 2TAF14 TaxID=3233007 RepID=UPI003F92687D
MEIILIIILAFSTIYYYTKLVKTKNEIKVKDQKIKDLTRLIAQLHDEISKYQNEHHALRNKLKNVKTELSYLQITNRELNEKIAELSKYQNIIDVKIECEYLLKKAQKDYEKLRERGNQELIEAQENAKESRKNIREITEKKQREIELLYENAVRESERIIATAENRAETIGGDAYR